MNCMRTVGTIFVRSVDILHKSEKEHIKEYMRKNESCQNFLMFPCTPSMCFFKSILSEFAYPLSSHTPSHDSH